MAFHETQIPINEPFLDPQARINRPWVIWFDETVRNLNQASDEIAAKEAAAQTPAASVSTVLCASGADSIDRTALNASLTTLVGEINAIKTVLNSLIVKLQAVDLMEVS